MRKILLVVSVAVLLLVSCFNDNGIKYTAKGEAKIFSTATLSDSYAEDTIIVIVQNEIEELAIKNTRGGEARFKTYDKLDFPGIPVKSVTDLIAGQVEIIELS